MLKFASKFNYNYLRNHITTKCDDGNNINNDDDGINIDFDDEVYFIYDSFINI